MQHITSQDGTIIAFDQVGQGPAVILVGGVLGDHSQQAPLAQLLASHFTVYNLDRRGHGESGDTPPYAVEREVEDLAALIEEAGGQAVVYGTSVCAILALEEAARGLAPTIKKLALWEPPYLPLSQGYYEQLTQMLREGQRGDMVGLFFTQEVGLPIELVARMRTQPFWATQEAHAHTLTYDATIRSDCPLRTERVAAVQVPTLVIDGGQSPQLTHAAQEVAAGLPNVQRRTLADQPHNVDPQAIAPVLMEFFKS